jgi:lipoprotein-anchoring transpeptidase ErfK/SrfK
MLQLKSVKAAALFCASLVGLSAAIDAAQASTHLVSYRSSYSAGTIVISMSQRKLYYVLNDDKAIQDPVAVAKPGKEWLGSTWIRGIRSAPEPPTAAFAC